MPSEPDSKSHYSYEEMISRLRQTREEGKVRQEERSFDPDTGKVTVRKRKRKRSGGGSGRLLRDPLGLRIARRCLFIGLPALLALVLLLYVVLSASVGTGVFEQGLGETLARRFGLAQPVRLQDCRLNGSTLSIGRAVGEGSGGSLLKSFAAEGTDLRLGLSSFFGGDWVVDFCTIRRGGIRLGQPGGEAGTGLPPPTGKSSGFFLSDRPGKMGFNGFSVWDGMLLLGTQPEDKAPGLRNVRASFSKREDSGAVYLDGQVSGGHDGTLRLPGWPDFNLENMRMQLFPDRAVVLRSLLKVATPTDSGLAGAGSPSGGRGTGLEDGTIALSGVVPFRPGAAADLKVSIRNLPLARLLPRGADRYLGEGAILSADGASLTWDAADPAGTWQLAGQGNLVTFRIRSLALIPALNDLTGGEIVDGLDADTCRVEFTVRPDGTTLDNIRIAATSKFQITGTARIETDGKLSGKLQFGLAPDLLLGRIPGFFKRGIDNFHWAEVTLGGVASAPIEDLTARLQAGANRADSPQGVPEASPPGLLDLEQGKQPETPKRGESDAGKAEEYFRSLTEDKPAPGTTPAPGNNP